MHEQGLIHYDVTPSNWLVEGDARRQVFTLTDGSLARIGPVDGPAIGTVLHPSPASPKANRGWAPQAESDLRGLGITL